MPWRSLPPASTWPSCRTRFTPKMGSPHSRCSPRACELQCECQHDARAVCAATGCTFLRRHRCILGLETAARVPRRSRSNPEMCGTSGGSVRTTTRVLTSFCVLCRCPSTTSRLASWLASSCHHPSSQRPGAQPWKVAVICYKKGAAGANSSDAESSCAC